jgi:hypothetical protein
VSAPNETTDIPKHLAELGEDERGHSVTAIRDLSIVEIAAIESADLLIIKAGNAAAWQRAHHLYVVTRDSITDLQEADQPGPGEIERVRAAAGSLSAALVALAQELEDNVQAYGADGVQSDFANHAEQVRDSDAWQLVREIADRDAGSFKAALTETVWQRASDEAVVNIAGAAFGAIRAAQDLLAHQYRAIGPAVTDAAKLLLSVKVEAPGGAPAIVEFTIEGDTPTNLKPRPLALGRIEPAMRAIRTASRFAGRENVAEQGSEEMSPGETEDAEGSGEAFDSGEDAASDTGVAESSAGEQEDESDQDPVEISALFSLARTLDGDLEKAWSAALDEALAVPAIEKQLGAVYSLVNVLQRDLARQAREMASAGVDSRMEEWPLSEGRLAALDPTPEPEERSKQSGLAQLNAFVDVMETFKDLKDPANITVSFNQEGESVERFWSAGAFALLKDRLWLLERLTLEQDRDVAAAIATGEGESPGPPTGADIGDAFERLRLGTRALTHGDPEAAIFHGLLAVASAVGVPSEEVAGKLAEDPGEGESRLSEDEVQILTMANRVVARSQSGAPDLPKATLLAQATLRAAHKLTLGPVGGPDLSPSEVAELIESRQPLRPLEAEESDSGGS